MKGLYCLCQCPKLKAPPDIFQMDNEQSSWVDLRHSTVTSVCTLYLLLPEKQCLKLSSNDVMPLLKNFRFFMDLNAFFSCYHSNMSFHLLFQFPLILVKLDNSLLHKAISDFTASVPSG